MAEKDNPKDGLFPWFHSRGYARQHFTQHDLLDRDQPTMKLWLDDLREPPDHTWTWATTSAWAIRLLTHFPCIEISFDYDLGGDDSGQIVADWIEQRIADGLMDLPQWSIHSANPVGRKYLALTLESCERLIRAQRTDGCRPPPSDDK